MILFPFLKTYFYSFLQFSDSYIPVLSYKGKNFGNMPRPNWASMLEANYKYLIRLIKFPFLNTYFYSFLQFSDSYVPVLSYKGGTLGTCPGLTGP